MKAGKVGNNQHTHVYVAGARDDSGAAVIRKLTLNREKDQVQDYADFQRCLAYEPRTFSLFVSVAVWKATCFITNLVY